MSGRESLSMGSGPGDSPNSLAEEAPPLDPVGAATLDLLRAHGRYSEFLWDRLGSLGEIEGKVLELGCGTGNITALILRQPRVSLLHAVDIDPGYIRRVREEIRDSRLEAFCSPAEAFTPPISGYDLVISINVLEHIEDDAAALDTVARALLPGGECRLLVPAHPALYTGLDAGLSHHRRYTRAGLEALASRAGLVPERSFHFNPLGALGWWFNGKVLRRKVLPGRQVALYDRIGVPVSRLLDRLNPFPFGISLIARLRRPR